MFLLSIQNSVILCFIQLCTLYNVHIIYDRITVLQTKNKIAKFWVIEQEIKLNKEIKFPVEDNPMKTELKPVQLWADSGKSEVM